MQQVFEECHETALSKGWWEGTIYVGPEGERVLHPLEISSKLALVHAEVSEGLEEVRKGEDHYQPYLGEKNKPEGLVIEMADAVIRMADLAGKMGLDLAEAIEMKMAYNKTRPHRHGGKKL